MAPLSVVTIVLAGGAGSRLRALTRDRAKPAVPYGAGYQLVDFSLSNAANSGLRDVWVVQQFHPVSLGSHLRSGRPWDLDRLDGGLLVLHPSQGTGRDGFHSGTADALWKQIEPLREAAPDVTVVVSADAVYRLDYDEVVRDHLDSFAELTMVTTRVAPEDASRYGVVRVGEDGAVTEYRYTPDTGITSTQLLGEHAAGQLPTLQQGTVGISLEFHPDGPVRINRDIRVGDVFEADLVNPDMVTLAKAYGAVAARVERTEQFADVFEQALACDRPFLIELMIDPAILRP